MGSRLWGPEERQYISYCIVRSSCRGDDFLRRRRRSVSSQFPSPISNDLCLSMNISHDSFLLRSAPPITFTGIVDRPGNADEDQKDNRISQHMHSSLPQCNSAFDNHHAVARQRDSGKGLRRQTGRFLLVWWTGHGGSFFLDGDIRWEHTTVAIHGGVVR